MILKTRSIHLPALALLFLLSSCPAFSQAAPTATQRLHVAAFAGLTGVYTGLEGGRNVALTTGINIGTGSFFRLHPFLELRGTVALNGGSVDSQRNVLGGLKVSKIFEHFQLYGDVL